MLNHPKMFLKLNVFLLNRSKFINYVNLKYYLSISSNPCYDRPNLQAKVLNRPRLKMTYVLSKNDFNPTLNNLNNIHTTAELNAKKAIQKESKGKSKPKVQLTDDEILEVIRIDVLRNQLDLILTKLKDNYTQQLSTRLATGSIENIMVSVDGDEYPLNELAQIMKKNPQLIAINMANFPEATKPTMEAIQASGLNISLQQDGMMIYVNIPRVTREHREAQSKKAKVMLNQCKEEMRSVQNSFIKDARNKKDVFSEDLIHNILEHIKFMVDEQAQKGEALLKTKEKELLGD